MSSSEFWAEATLKPCRWLYSQCAIAPPIYDRPAHFLQSMQGKLCTIIMPASPRVRTPSTAPPLTAHTEFRKWFTIMTIHFEWIRDEDDQQLRAYWLPTTRGTISSGGSTNNKLGHPFTSAHRWIKFHRHKRRKRSMAFRTTCGCLYWWWSVMEQGEKTWALRIVFRWHWHNTIPTTSPGYCVSHWRRSKVKRKTKRAAVGSSSSIVHIIGRTQKKSWKTERKKILRKDSPSSCMAHHGSFCFFLLSLSLLEHSLVPSFHRL